MNPLLQKIFDLKSKHNALILSHYYESGEIQDLADHVGDSLFLAQRGQKAKNPVVLLAGVVFMAETVKILSPDKTVLAPDLNAGCSLVDQSPAEEVARWKASFPNSLLITYVNSSAKLKAISDVIVTSSNAEKIVRSLPENRDLLFAPDRNLGRYISQKTGRQMHLWPGACEVHVLFSARKMFELKTKYPSALVLAHPECVDDVLAQADVIGSTSHLLNEVKTNSHDVFIVATEPGILHQMRKYRPEATLIEAPAEGSCACNECPYMKLNTLEKISAALENLSPSIQVTESVAARARIPLERMMALTEGRKVHWPKENVFQL